VQQQVPVSQYGASSTQARTYAGRMKVVDVEEVPVSGGGSQTASKPPLVILAHEMGRWWVIASEC
jgi:hypothetical protein